MPIHLILNWNGYFAQLWRFQKLRLYIIIYTLFIIITTASANYQAALHTQEKQKSEIKISLFWRTDRGMEFLY